jgi:acetyltransferase
LIDIVPLMDGGRVVVPPVLPQDRELMMSFFHNLTDEDRCNRFMHPVSEPSSELLRQFTHVDYVDHVAPVAETLAEPPEVCLIGPSSSSQTLPA